MPHTVTGASASTEGAVNDWSSNGTEAPSGSITTSASASPTAVTPLLLCGIGAGAGRSGTASPSRSTSASVSTSRGLSRQRVVRGRELARAHVRADHGVEVGLAVVRRRGRGSGSGTGGAAGPVNPSRSTTRSAVERVEVTLRCVP